MPDLYCLVLFNNLLCYQSNMCNYIYREEVYHNRILEVVVKMLIREK